MKKFYRHNLLLKFLSLLVALILWATIKGGEKEEALLSLDLEIVNMPAKLITDNDQDRGLQVKISGPRARMKKIIKEYPRIYPLDASSAKVGWHSYPINLEKNVAKLPRGVRIVNVDPYIFRVRYRERQKKEVKVVLDLKGNPTPPFRLSNVDFTPKKVVVSGRKSALKNIQQISSKQINLAEVETNINGKFGLITNELESKGLRLESEPFIEVDIEVVKEKKKNVRRKPRPKK